MKYDPADKAQKALLVKIFTELGLLPDHKDECKSIAALAEIEEFDDLRKFITSKIDELYPHLVKQKVSVLTKKETKVSEKKTSGITISRGVMDSAYMMLIHGDPKTGKTTLLSSCPDIVIGDLELGSRKLDCARVSISDWEGIVSFVDWFFTEQDEFRNGAIDTMNRLEMYARAYVCKKHGVEDIGEYDKKTFGKGTIELNSMVAKLLISIRNRVIESDKSMIFVGHSDIKNCPNPEGENYERHTLGVGKELVKFTCGIMDHLLFAHKRVNIVAADPNDKNSKIIAKGGNIYQLHTGGNAAIISGTRNANLPQILQMPSPEASREELEKFWSKFR